MKEENEKREKIMPDNEYQLMIQLINELVREEKLPIIKSKLKSLNISNDLLSFSFWVLHKELYTTKKIRPYFIEFLKAVFENFSNVEKQTIKGSFGTKSRVTKDYFLPQIISRHL